MEDAETLIILLIASYYCFRLGRLAYQLRFLNCAHEQKQIKFMCECILYLRELGIHFHPGRCLNNTKIWQC